MKKIVIWSLVVLVGLALALVIGWFVMLANLPH